MRMNNFIEVMAFEIHERDHTAFEEASIYMSEIVGKDYTMFYEWCSKCKTFLESREKKTEKKNEAKISLP
jgi:hypothetical protein